MLATLGAVLFVHAMASASGVCPATDSQISGGAGSSSQCFVESFASSNNSSSTLDLLVLVPGISLAGSDTGWDRYLSVLPALDLAVEQINNRTDFLPCHCLRLIYRETGCNIDVPTTLLSLTSSLFPRPTQNTSDGGTSAAMIVGAIGPVCSESAIRVSSLTNRPDLRLVVLHTSDTSELADRQKYPYSLGLLGSTQPLVRLSLALMNESGWRNVTILYDSSHSYYSAIMKDLVPPLEMLDVKINYLPLIGVASRWYYPMDQVMSSKVRIVFAFTSMEHSIRMLCLAHHINLLYPRYQWVFFNQQLDDFKRACRNSVSIYQWGRYYNCSCELLLADSLEGAFLINHQMTSPEFFSHGFSGVFPYNTSLRKFTNNLYNRKVDTFNNNSDVKIYPTRWAHIMYDAVWAWGEVLNRLTTAAGTFEYGGKRLADSEAVLNEFYSINFQGISGQISFNSNSGFVNRLADLHQVMGGVKKRVAYGNKTTVVVLQTFNYIPDVVEVVNLPHIGFVSFFLVIHFVEIMFVFALQMLTFMYRHTKLVKASSPKLIQSAFLGCYTSVICLILYQFFFTHKLNPTVGTVICHALWIWLLPISYSLSEGIIILRAWRLYRIFVHFRNPGKCVSNQALLNILAGLVLIDVLTSIIWTAAFPSHYELIEITSNQLTNDFVLLEQRCNSEQSLWVVVYMNKFILIAAMIVLSLLTHRIPNQAFSTQLLRVFSYLYSLILVLGLTLYYFYELVDRVSNIDYYIFSVLSNILLLLFITLVVIPPLLPVIQHKLKKLFKSSIQPTLATL